MKDLTLNDIAIALSFILLLIGYIKAIIKEVKVPIDKRLKEAIKPVQEEIADLKETFKNHEIDAVKRDLVNLMCLAEQGSISQEQKKLAHELFDEYTEAGRNSYVHDKWEILKKEGKI